jgi:hypothetical protein
VSKTVKIASLCLVLAIISAVATSSASAAPPNYKWVEGGITINKNTAISIETKPTTVFKLHGSILGVKTTVECATVAVKNGFIFNGFTNLTNEVGQDKGEIEFSKCKTSVCTSVAEPIKLPPLGGGESTIVADKKERAIVEKLYDDFLPNNSNEFMEVVLSGGICGAGATFKVTTPTTRGGLGSAKEGEGGLVGEVDKGVVAAETEAGTHELTFDCNNETQIPAVAFKANEGTIVVDKLELAGKTVCLEGTMLVRLVSGKGYFLRTFP